MPECAIYPPTYMHKVLKLAYDSSMKDDEYHIVEAVSEGKRHIFRVYQQGNDVTHLWSESEED
jgi:hypothetical protein